METNRDINQKSIPIYSISRSVLDILKEMLEYLVCAHFVRLFFTPPTPAHQISHAEIHCVSRCRFFRSVFSCFPTRIKVRGISLEKSDTLESLWWINCSVSAEVKLWLIQSIKHLSQTLDSRVPQKVWASIFGLRDRPAFCFSCPLYLALNWHSFLWLLIWKWIIGEGSDNYFAWYEENSRIWCTMKALEGDELNPLAFQYYFLKITLRFQEGKKLSLPTPTLFHLVTSVTRDRQS